MQCSRWPANRSRYLKDGNYLKPAEDRGAVKDERFSEYNFTLLQDQKVMLQERLKTAEVRTAEVEALLTDANVARHAATVRAAKLEGDCSASKKKIESLNSELQQKMASFEKTLSDHSADIETERSTYEKSREGLNDMYAALEKQIETERGMREEVEAEMGTVLATKKELEIRVDELSADSEQKQKTIEGLRAQLKEVKALNMTMLASMQDTQGKVKESELAVHEKTEELEKARAELLEASRRMQGAATDRKRLEATILELSDRHVSSNLAPHFDCSSKPSLISCYDNTAHCDSLFAHVQRAMSCCFLEHAAVRCAYAFSWLLHGTLDFKTSMRSERHSRLMSLSSDILRRQHRPSSSKKG